MTPFATRVLLPAALICFAPDAALMGQSVRHIHIQCDPASDSPVCAGLRDAMAERFPHHTVTTSAPAGQSTVVHLVTEQPRPDTLSGHITWTTADGQSGQSRALQLSVMDAELDDAMRRDFGAQLAAFFTPSQKP